MTVPTFTTRDGTVYDDGHPVASYFADNGLAAAHVKHLRREHAAGRVAQGSCGNRDRIHDIGKYARGGGRPVVLCAEHKRELAGVPRD